MQLTHAEYRLGSGAGTSLLSARPERDGQLPRQSRTRSTGSRRLSAAAVVTSLRLIACAASASRGSNSLVLMIEDLTADDLAVLPVDELGLWLLRSLCSSDAATFQQAATIDRLVRQAGEKAAAEQGIPPNTRPGRGAAPRQGAC